MGAGEYAVTTRRFDFIPDPHRPGVRHAVPVEERDAHWCGDGVPCGCGEDERTFGAYTYVLHRRVRCPSAPPEAWEAGA